MSNISKSRIVVARQTTNQDQRTGLRHYYWCSGCNLLHGIAIKQHTEDNGASWEFTGTLECPTYSPSQLTTYSYWTGHDTPPQNFVCHTFIKNGMIEFLTDCTHALAGQTLLLPPMPEWVFAED